MRRGCRQHQRENGTHRATLASIALLAAAASAAASAGCVTDVASVDAAFYDGDGRKVHCPVNLDESARTMPSVDGALDRARDRGEIVELYAHKPGVTIDVADIKHVLAGARDRGLAFVTYADFAARTDVRPGLALSFDDNSIEPWHMMRPLLRQYGARVTFFISRYANMSPETKRKVRELADDGHDIAAHTVLHLRAPAYVEEYGLAAYMADDAVPSIQVLREDGYPVTSFAYPYGARTRELDDALLQHVPVLRSVAFSVEGVPDPCPR